MEENNWLFLRGLGRERRHWLDFPEKFQAKFPNAKIEFLDFPGLGESIHEPTSLDLDSFVFKLRDRCSLVREKKPFHILALSFGGMVAMHWASLYPNDFLKMVVVNSSAGNLNPWHERIQPRAIGIILNLFNPSEPTKKEEILMNLLTRKPEQHHAAIQQWSSISKSCPLDWKVLLQQLWLSKKFEISNLKSPHIQVLFLAGLGDQLVNPVCTENLAKHWGAEPVYHPWAGHEITLDDPDWVLDQIKKMAGD
ncbi:MAG: alpha/beta hydrolase [Bdellovibrionales bacterium]|nr:alpha/beta hydrolase [Bdellovibrionales bacterium]